MDMSEKIKFYREKRGMTLEELGNKVGVSKSTVLKWETGSIANMKRDKISKVAKALNVSPAYLMGWVEDPHGYVQLDISGVVEAITESTMQAIERGEIEIPKYYENEETAELAQEIFENEDMRLLFDAAKGSKPEDIKRAADFLKMLKATNPEG